ncbi:hypothetical protein BsIDN1_31310 [Bacillus safensis]|uniref:Uncharacterized protein n=1 Tax=Bacillus safensis TaxID=561879 RepID=A0A5S9M8R0_BACIA|nr:hypothetical protein BsIDN1_31310 [Bacillus safensis]
MSDDRKMTKLDVILEKNPYGNDALSTIKQVEASVERALPETNLKDASFGVSGVSSMNADKKTAVRPRFQ